MTRGLCLLLLVAAVAGAHAQEITRAPLPANHPLVGSWRAELPRQNCFEEYDIRADGTRTSVSGEERSESEFVISVFPSAKGFYKWTDRITRTNGKKDCTGYTTPPGNVATNYVSVHPGGQRLLVCAREELASCFIEFQRKALRP